MTFFAIGLNYETAPLAVREGFALGLEETRGLLASLALSEGAEVIILSTCNRTEVYLFGLPADVAAVKEALSRSADQEWDERLAFCHEDEAAVRHVLRVASGMKSMVVGDVQILAQMKEAYRLAVEADRIGTVVHRLMHTAFRTAKRVFSSTGVGTGAASVSSAAVALARAHFGGTLGGRHIALVGTGEVGKLVLQALHSAKPASITLVNRSRENADSLCQEFPVGTVADWADRHEVISRSDCVVVATAADAHIVRAEDLSPVDSWGETLVLDLSVPRNVEPAIDALPGFHVLDMDDLEAWTKNVEEARRLELPKANEIVEEELGEFVTWMFHQQALQPAIQTIRDTFDQIRRQEIEKYQHRFKSADREELDQLTRSIMQKLLAVPIVRLKASDPESVDLVKGVKLLQSFFSRPDCEDVAPPTLLGDSGVGAAGTEHDATLFGNPRVARA